MQSSSSCAPGGSNTTGAGGGGGGGGGAEAGEVEAGGEGTWAASWRSTHANLRACAHKRMHQPTASRSHDASKTVVYYTAVCHSSDIAELAKVQKRSSKSHQASRSMMESQSSSGPKLPGGSNTTGAGGGGEGGGGGGGEGAWAAS